MNKKYIYFPTTADGGPRWMRPRILYVLKEWPDGTVTGSFEPITDGRHGGLFSVSRLVPYTDERWKICEDYLRKLDRLEREHQRLLKQLRKA